MQQTVQNPTHISRTLQLQRIIGNQATQRLLQREDESAKKPPSKTMYMGMNPGASGEAKKLKGILKDDVLLAMNDPALEKSLADEVGIVKWMMSETPLLINNAVKFLLVYDALLATDAAARDQMAQVMKMFYAAEQGQFTLERIVLSGHSNGVELWGDEAKNFQPGKFLLDSDLDRLVKAFPTAAAQVEDVMFSACYTVSSIALVVKAFPNLRTVWGYSGKSPSAGAGAEEHIAQWEKETKGDQTLQAKDGVGKAALWTREAAKDNKGNGFIRNDPSKADLKQLKSDFYGMSINVIPMVHGEAPLNQSTLNNAYDYVQLMLAHPDFAADSDRGRIETWRTVLLRMRFYSLVSVKFASAYATQIKAGYDAIGRKIPDFSKMSRGALKTEMAAFKKALETTPNVDGQAFYDTYLEGLWKFNPDIIKSEWI